MLIAKLENGTYVVADHTSFFPNTSFRQSGPSAEFLQENSCFRVATYKEYNTETEQLEPTDPYLEGDFVFTVKVVTKSAEQQAQEHASKVEALRQEVVNRTQARLDTFAATKNYDGILSACTYATDPNSAFAAEGQRAVELRSATWAKLYTIMADVEQGKRQLPSSFEEIEGELPALTW